MQKAIQASLRPAFLTTIAKVQSANRIIEYPRHQKPDLPYFLLRVILCNVRR